MKNLSAKIKEQALKEIEMYFCKPPYDSEHVRYHLTSGLFEQQSLMKYGLTPIELMKELKVIKLSKKAKHGALKDLKMYFGEPPVLKSLKIDFHQVSWKCRFWQNI